MYFNDEKKNTNIDAEFNDNENIFLKFLNKRNLIIGLVVLVFIVGVIILFPLFSKKEYYLVLNGLEEVIVYQNSEYIDPGYFAYDNKNNDYTNEVVVSGMVNTSVIGEYKITYSYKDIVKERIVTVMGDVNQVTFLNLLGSKVIYLNVGSVYLEPGYVVVDSVDDDLQDKVVIDGRVDTNKVGAYKLVYSVINSSGVTINAERTIIVMGTDISLNYSPIEYTNDKVVINLVIDDNYFDYVLLPDNTKIVERNVSYEVLKNGSYKFKIYSKNGDFKEQEITISNIDKDKPTGSCSGDYSDDKSSITINAQDKGSGIDKFVIDGNVYKTNKITLNGKMKKSEVTIYDKTGNSNVISCSITTVIKYPRSYTSNKGSYPYMLYIPPRSSKSTKLPLVVFLHGSGESGGDLNRLNKSSFPKYISQGKDYNFMMIAPQMTTYERESNGWEPARVMKIINDVINQYPIDTNRIIVTGFSLGGIGTYRMIKSYPGFFAGAIPVAGTNSYKDSLLKTKIWAFHGSLDASVKYADAKATMDMVIAKNPDSKFTTFEGYGHNVTELVYTDPKVINWIMSVRKY